MLSQKLVPNSDEYDTNFSYFCRLCLGHTPPPIKYCLCSYIHDGCLRIQISKELKYHNNENPACKTCHKQFAYELVRYYRCRNQTQMVSFFIVHVLPQILMGVLLLIGLAINESCLVSIKAETFWTKIIKIYLVLVGVYLQLLFIFLGFVIYEGFREEFYVRNFQAENINLLK